MKGKMYLLFLGLAIMSYFIYSPFRPEPKEGKPATISGKVVNEENKPVAKARIRSLETDERVFTDRDGLFTIEATEKGTLVATHSKYRTNEVHIEGKNNLEITLLKEDSAFIARIKKDFPDVELTTE